jgi:hypothetical protein
MKNLFYNSKSCNTACITINSSGNDIKLYYHLNDNPVQEVWQQFSKPETLYSTHPLAKLTIDQATEKLVEIASKLGLAITVPITQLQLNILHRCFVDYTTGPADAWADLNKYIHVTESLLADTFADYNSVITFTHATEPAPVPIKEDYKLWLTTEEHWGDLLLGYATNGKDWIDIAKDNDTLIDLNVQSTISPEAIMFFHVEYPYVKHTERMFSAWAKDNGITMDNLSQLALGRYVLGHIIITEDFLKFHPIASDWYVPNHVCKLEWNRDLIKIDTKVVNVEFFDSDMYYDSILAHTNIGKLSNV